MSSVMNHPMWGSEEWCGGRPGDDEPEAGPPDFRQPCPAAPDEKSTGWHEVMAGELRCVYCGIALAPVQCNGCGRFMSCTEIRENESRCGDCA